ncbi:YkgJ family cysteine cluster protein [Extibacter muris]|uniref:YkgJ family cysteine cluster protein n=1 Tax=Extibacter muris TaxID=1796622 RepID=A0A4R4FF12_9FIRM|nr:YkgJ family cysteine cluster protein [Extibacter muris]MCU0079268.1 YkgJ family cysteine cluster protein [Extibacter muris]TDA21998.1 YkgJ family cysteine cluster protein [Extibacter muris]
MKRKVDLKDISDGRLYSSNDMVRADCYNCEGCSACCRGMGSSIVLDPLDIQRLCKGLSVSFDGLMERHIELHAEDGMIVPNLKMDGKEEACAFLDARGRCSIHPFRPGLCRLFPLGRYYEEDGFRYFLQIHECRKKDRGKTKVRKWLDTPDLKAYEQYITDWHGFLTGCQEAAGTLDEEQARILNLFVLKTFYQLGYKTEDFYQEFYTRLSQAREKLGI